MCSSLCYSSLLTFDILARSAARTKHLCRPQKHIKAAATDLTSTFDMQSGKLVEPSLMTRVFWKLLCRVFCKLPRIRPAHRSVYDLGNRPVHRSVYDLGNCPVHRSVNYLVYRHVRCSVNYLVYRHVHCSVN